MGAPCRPTCCVISEVLRPQSLLSKTATVVMPIPGGLPLPAKDRAICWPSVLALTPPFSASVRLQHRDCFFFFPTCSPLWCSPRSPGSVCGGPRHAGSSGCCGTGCVGLGTAVPGPLQLIARERHQGARSGV